MMNEQRQSRFERGLVLMDCGHYEEARDYLEKSLEKEGYSEECYLAYTDVSAFLDGETGDRHEDDDDDGDGIDELEEAGLIAAEQGIRELQKGHYGRAIQKLREAVEVVPESATQPLLVALITKAGQYMERRLFRKAILLYDECLTLQADNSQTYYLRAWAHLHADNIDEAHVDVRRAQALLQEEDAFLEFDKVENLEAGETETRTEGATTMTPTTAITNTTIPLSNIALKRSGQAPNDRYRVQLLTN